jgi:hypothetical protein
MVIITFEDVGMIMAVKCAPAQVCKDGDVKEMMQQAIRHDTFFKYQE